MKLIILMMLFISCSNEELNNRIRPLTPPPSSPELLNTSNINLNFPSIQLSYLSSASSYQVEASGGVSSLVYSCHDCATGVSVDASTGVVSWNLSDEGRYSSVLKVADSEGYILFKFDIENIYSFDDFCAGNSSSVASNNLISWLFTYYSSSDCSGLKTALQAETKLNITGSEKINLNPLAEFTNIESLTARNHNISSLVALSSYTNLEYLDVSGNELENLDGIYSLTKLKMIHASNNLIARLNKITSLVNLESIDLSKNIISELADISVLSKLEVLDLSHNLLSKLALNSLPESLKEVYLENNSLSDLSVLYDFRNLMVLDVSSNQIKSLDTISDLSSLRVLSLGLNPIRNLGELSKLHNLNKLSLVGLFNFELEDVEKPQ